jgi:hypothetical protein
LQLLQNKKLEKIKASGMEQERITATFNSNGSQMLSCMLKKENFQTSNM